MSPFPIKNIKPNPFRHIERYPIRREKVAALRESMRTTGYWGNIVARSVGGTAEIAYGHHRLVALQEEYGPSHKVDLLIRDLSDDAMLQIMARENMEEWGTSAAVEHETVRAVVEAFAQGRVHLAAISGPVNKSHIRFAPSFVPGVEDAPEPAREHPYTAQTVANFIGWCEPSGEPQAKVHDALSALQFIEEGLLKESDFDGLMTSQARAVISEARKARERRAVTARAHRLQAEQAARDASAAQRRKEEAEQQRRQREAEAAAAQNRSNEADRERRQREAEAAAAQKRREAADKERRQREAEAARARDEVARRRAQEQAARAAREQQNAEEARRRAQEQVEEQRRKQQQAEEARRRAREEAGRSEQQRREAEDARQQAQKRQRAAEKQMERQETEGRRSATIVGRAVSEELKAGRIGYKRASDVATKLEGQKSGPPPNIEDFTRRLMSEVTKILRQDADPRVARLDEIVKYREHLSDVIREDAAETLRQAADRCLHYADELWPKGRDAHAKPDRRLLVNRNARDVS